MLAANEELEQVIAQDPDSNVAIDYISDEEKPYIEMEIQQFPLNEDDDDDEGQVSVGGSSISVGGGSSSSAASEVGSASGTGRKKNLVEVLG